MHHNYAQYGAMHQCTVRMKWKRSVGVFMVQQVEMLAMIDNFLCWVLKWSLGRAQSPSFKLNKIKLLIVP